MLERLALEQFHHQERRALVAPDLVDDADVRMIERRGCPRLAHEAIEDVLVLGDLLRQELERHLPPQLGVLGLVDDTHAAAADFGEDSVVADSRSNHFSASKAVTGYSLGAGTRSRDKRK